MRKIIAYGEIFEVDKAIQTGDSIIGYVGSQAVLTASGISDFAGYRYEDADGNQIPWDKSIAPQPDAAALAQQVTDLQLALAELYEGVLGNG